MKWAAAQIVSIFIDRSVARIRELKDYRALTLGLTPQALCLHLLRRFLCKGDWER